MQYVYRSFSRHGSSYINRRSTDCTVALKSLRQIPRYTAVILGSLRTDQVTPFCCVHEHVITRNAICTTLPQSPTHPIQGAIEIFNGCSRFDQITIHDNKHLMATGQAGLSNRNNVSCISHPPTSHIVRSVVILRNS